MSGASLDRPPAAQAQAEPLQVSLAALFVGFMEIALSGFGGVLAWAHRSLVEKRGWLSEHEFAEVLGLCQAVPGGNIVNLSIVVGTRFRGLPGALAALLGLFSVPFVLVLGLAALYAAGGEVPALRAALRGIAAAAAGLVVATGLKMVWAYRDRPWALALAGLALGAVGLLRWPLLPVLLALGPIGIVLAWRAER
jgi:chromate transporter